MTVKKAIAILGMIALLSPPLLAAAEAPQTIVPNGVARIGAANEGAEPLDYAGVGIAIVDTGIALDNADLNVVGGVDCSNGTGYTAGSERIEGAQRSVWEPAPLIKVGEDMVPDPEIVSFDGLRFEIATIENPVKIGGFRSGVSGYDDGNGHGTHVAGIAAARDNGLGVVGVAPGADLYSVRVLNGQGGGSFESIICGLDWVTANSDKIDVVNMSLGGNVGRKVMDVIEPCDTDEDDYPPYVKRTELMKDELHEAVCDVVEAGIPVVVAAGNGWGDASTIVPAAYPEVITVSSFADFDGLPGGRAVDLDPDPDVSTVSSCPGFGGTDDMFFTHLNGAPELGYGSFGGEVVDISAPGVCVFSTFPNSGFASLTGTSMAAPHVTGVVARIVADNGGMDAEGLRELLLDAAEPQPNNFRDSDDWNEPILRVP